MDDMATKSEAELVFRAKYPFTRLIKNSVYAGDTFCGSSDKGRADAFAQACVNVATGRVNPDPTKRSIHTPYHPFQGDVSSPYSRCKKCRRGATAADHIQAVAQ
jgi:hypothetical protein